MPSATNTKTKHFLKAAVRNRKEMLAFTEATLKQLGVDKLLRESEQDGGELSRLKAVWQFPLTLYFRLSTKDRGLAEAFDYCGLDPSLFSHWRLLLDALVDAVFRHPGAKEIWTPWAYLDVLEDVELVRDIRPKTAKKDEIEKRLRTRFPDKYKRYEKSSLLKIVGAALNPKKNPAVLLPKEHRPMKLAYHILAESLHDDHPESVLRILLDQDLRNLIERLRTTDPRFAAITEREREEVMRGAVDAVIEISSSKSASKPKTG